MPGSGATRSLLCCGRPGDDRIDDLFAFLVSQRVDGILLVSASSAAQELLPSRAQGNPPPCCWGMCRRRPPAAGSTPSAPTITWAAPRRAAYLHRLGQPTGAVSGPPRRDSVTHALRLQGFLGHRAAAWQMEAQVVYNDLGRGLFCRQRATVWPGRCLPAISRRRRCSPPSDAMALGVLQAAGRAGRVRPPAASLCWDTTTSNMPPCPRSASAPWPSPTGALAPERRGSSCWSWWREDAPPLLYPQAHHPPGWWSGAPAGPLPPRRAVTRRGRQRAGGRTDVLPQTRIPAGAAHVPAGLKLHRRRSRPGPVLQGRDGFFFLRFPGAALGRTTEIALQYPHF